MWQFDLNYKIILTCFKIWPFNIISQNTLIDIFLTLVKMLLWFIVYLSIAHVAISRGNLDLLPLEHDVVVSKGKLYVEGYG